LKRFINGVLDPPLVYTDDLHEIERRLLTFVSPNALEHLVIALLQLERPHETWWHIGGSGDGGSDGLGYTNDWIPTGQVQCKWLFSGSHSSEVFGTPNDCMKRILVSLIYRHVVQDVQNAEFWGRDRIASLVKRHAKDLPIAKSLRVTS
jgi:hypothetical protein